MANVFNMELPPALALEFESKYSLQDRCAIGTGASGTIIAARVRELAGALGAPVAVKLVKGSNGIEEACNFERCGSHPNIIQLVDVFATPDCTIMVMERAEVDLLTYAELNGPLYELQACKFAMGMVAGLERIHERGVAHLDIKLENVLLSSDGQVKLADFGLSLVMRNGALPTLPEDWGTSGYQAPEIVNRDRISGPAADVWALGIALYVMICGMFPFDRRVSDGKAFFEELSMGAHCFPEFLSRPFAELLHGMLALDPFDRATLGEICQSLQVIIDCAEAENSCSVLPSRASQNPQNELSPTPRIPSFSMPSPTNVQHVNKLGAPPGFENVTSADREKRRGAQTTKEPRQCSSRPPPLQISEALDSAQISFEASPQPPLQRRFNPAWGINRNGLVDMQQLTNSDGAAELSVYTRMRAYQ